MIKLLNGDCLKLLPKLKSHSIDMILADLPYGTTQNKWDSIIPLRLLWKEYRKLIKKRGVIVLFSDGVFSAKLILSNLSMYKYDWIWIKSKATNFLNAKHQPLRKHEHILVFYKHPPVYHPQMRKSTKYNKGFRKNQLTGSYGEFKPVEVKSNGLRYPTDILYFKTAESEGKVYHPTQKPIGLLKYLIKTYTNKNNLVLDNVMGSGSTGVACKKLKRNFIGIEIDKRYFEIAKNRIDKA